MGDASDDHEARVVVDRVHDAVRAGPDPINIASGEPYDPGRSGLAGKAVDRGRDAGPQRVLETPICASRLRMEPDLVRVLGRGGYVRTSDQGRVASRSSRAWRAARLSSRYSSRSISSA